MMATRQAAATATRSTKANGAPVKAPTTPNPPAVQEKQLPATSVESSWMDDSGMGLEGADKASFAIPFLIVLQSNSPQIETVEGAKPGMFMNSVTEELYEAVRVIPVAFQRRYLAWMPRASGGGYKGEYTVADVEGPGNKLGWKHVIIPPNTTPDMQLPDGSILRDTRNHFILILDDAGGAMQAMFSFSRTQIKRSKKWVSRISNIQVKHPESGKVFVPPSFSHVYKCTTVNEENDRGKWKGIQIDLEGPVPSKELYDAAKAFHKLIIEGQVHVSPPVDVETATDSEAF